ncbi:hypothetical protein E3N88_03558 [Mikania micrantha]|uniref:Uncharacterized protein n=1 Tax=Mikania micrantha TaxID=192012 RepID=A0A5N6Q720_9ASTR|nr:hypothetical protein E3N88_03558 [Mikania micrantha]
MRCTWASSDQGGRHFGARKEGGGETTEPPHKGSCYFLFKKGDDVDDATGERGRKAMTLNIASWNYNYIDLV